MSARDPAVTVAGMRWLLFVSGGSDRSCWPLCFGALTAAPEGRRGDRFSISFRTPSTAYGTHRQYKAHAGARQWWIVEARNADSGRRIITERAPEMWYVETPAGRVLDYGKGEHPR